MVIIIKLLIFTSPTPDELGTHFHSFVIVVLAKFAASIYTTQILNKKNVTFNILTTYPQKYFTVTAA